MPSGEVAMTSRARTDPGSGAQLSGFAQGYAKMAERADLDVVFLQEICELVAGGVPDVTVSFMGEGGCIIASSARERLGDVHEGAASVMRGEADSFEVAAETAARSATMREGIGQPVVLGNRRVVCLALAAPLPVARA